MKILKISLLVAALFICLILQNCKAITSENIQSKVETEITPQSAETPIEQENKIQLPATGKVEFKGVSFTYNSQIFEKVEVEEVNEQPLENETDKADYIHPRNIHFTFKNRNQDRESSIAIFPLADFRRIWTAPGDKNAEYIDKKLEAVRKVIEDKNFRQDNEIPYLAPYDVRETFIAKAKNVSFDSGKGIFFLTQFNQDFANLVNNDELIYIFQGISGDGRNYVFAEFPVSISFLPDIYDSEFEGYKIPRNYSEYEKGEKQYRQYIEKITRRLENLPSDKYEPNLKYFEEIISSLKIEN